MNFYNNYESIFESMYVIKADYELLKNRNMYIGNIKDFFTK